MLTQGRAGLPLPTPAERCCQNRFSSAWEGCGEHGDDHGTGTAGSQPRSGVCMCVWGTPGRAGWGDLTSLLRTRVLFLTTLGLPSRGVGGDQTVCSGASVTGCREEGSPARVWAPGTSRAGQPHRPRPPRGLRPAGRGLPAARGLRRTVQQRLLHDGCGFSGQNVQALGDLAPSSHSSGSWGRRGQGRAVQMASVPRACLNEAGAQQYLPRCSPFHGCKLLSRRQI